MSTITQGIENNQGHGALERGKKNQASRSMFSKQKKESLPPVAGHRLQRGGTGGVRRGDGEAWEFPFLSRGGEGRKVPRCSRPTYIGGKKKGATTPHAGDREVG